MIKADLIAVVHAQTGLSYQECREAVETAFALIKGALQRVAGKIVRKCPLTAR